MRARISNELGVELYDIYGLTEVYGPVHNAILAPAYNLSRAATDLFAGNLRALWLLLPAVLLTAFDAASTKCDVIARIGGWRPLWRWTVYVAFVVLLILYAPDAKANTQFIYFQF